MFELTPDTPGISLQDRDLLQRLNNYFETIDSRMRTGEGWVIFNAPGPRASRITRFVLHRANDLKPALSYLFMPWRDFSLTSYMVQVELKSVTALDSELTEQAKRELEIATRVSRQTMVHSVTADLLIVAGLHPQHEHEVKYLEDTIERRYTHRLPTIIITPEQPHELAADVANSASEGAESWRRLSARLYETNLIAI